MSRLPLVLFLIVGAIAGFVVFNSRNAPPLEAAQPERDVPGIAGSEAEPPRVPEARASEPEGRESELPAETTSAPPAAEPTPGPGEDAESHAERMARIIDEDKRVILDRSATLDAKGSAFKSLGTFDGLVDGDPRNEDILREAVWILGHTDDEGVLDDVLDGIEDVQDDDLVEPVISLVVNHPSARIRKAGVEHLSAYDSDRARSTVEYAARYDSDERVRRAAGGE